MSRRRGGLYQPSSPCRSRGGRGESAHEIEVGRDRGKEDAHRRTPPRCPRRGSSQRVEVRRYRRAGIQRTLYEESRRRRGAFS